ncbi:MAG TPA: hypothetical protein VH497_00615 [Vicinamibacterales bacterium]|jgi:hypothetical protein
MIRIVLAAVLLLILPQQAEINLTGEWSAVVTAPRGELEYTMYLTHEGPRLTGYFQSQYGEIPLKGSVKGTDVNLSWTMIDGSKEIAVTMTGTVNGDTIRGTAKLGTIGEGAFRAERAAGE